MSQKHKRQQGECIYRYFAVVIDTTVFKNQYFCFDIFTCLHSGPRSGGWCPDWYLADHIAKQWWNIFRVTGHLCGEFTGDRLIPRTKANDAELWFFFFDLCLNKRLSKQFWGWWFETPSRSYDFIVMPRRISIAIRSIPVVFIYANSGYIIDLSSKPSYSVQVLCCRCHHLFKATKRPYSGRPWSA